VGKLEGRRSLGRPRRTWLDSIRADLVEVRWGDVDWIGLAQVESSCEFGIEPSGSIKLGNYRVSKQLGISRVVLNSMELEQAATCVRSRVRFAMRSSNSFQFT
jgi:hypothetical protein